MRIAILSDIHSNSFALQAVLHEVNKRHINQLRVLGDFFGYYPWACETFNLLKPFLENSFFIKGNHDQLLLDNEPPQPLPSYWKMARHNRGMLLENEPAAIHWLNTLKFSNTIHVENIEFNIFHGTPMDEESGRFYPDSEMKTELLGAKKGFILLGHTHYPLLKNDNIANRIIFNPGSVGQPRDGDPNPSWGIFDTETISFNFERTSYDFGAAVTLLKELNWDERSIASLQKRHYGKL